MDLQERRSERRLATILVADVVGSSRWMEADEAGALSAIEHVLREMLDPAVKRHFGRIVKKMGDGALVEFSSPVEATLCAVEVQASLAELREARQGALDKLELRIGINFGDTVVSPDGDLHGDSVNVAARLEGLAEPNAICISEKVFLELEGKLALPFEDQGPQTLKNILRPIRAYALKITANSTRQPKAARPAQSRADRPSIAILPFTNLSGDPEQEYLAEGIAEDILTELAKSRWLFVMARNSSFAFKGKALETDEIARRLGVRYILSGSLRRSGPRIRISAQLVDAESGGSIWTERFDKELTDIFALQDEITESVAGAIEPELLRTEVQRSTSHQQSLTAWSLVRRGIVEFNRFQAVSHLAARELFRQAVDHEPQSPDGYIWLARAETGLASYGWAADARESLQAAMAASLQAVQLDERNPYAHYSAAVSHAFAGRFDIALRSAQRAVALSPSYAMGHFVLGATQVLSGHPSEAIEPLEHALRLSPYDPQSFSWFEFLALAYYFEGQFEKALEDARRALTLRPGWEPALAVILMCSLKLGDKAQSIAALRGLKTSHPAKNDVLSLVTAHNPQWAAQIETAVSRAEEIAQAFQLDDPL